MAAHESTACGRCGDSFAGSPAAGRAWLAAHTSSAHRPAPAVTVPAPDLLTQVTRGLVPALGYAAE